MRGLHVRLPAAFHLWMWMCGARMVMQTIGDRNAFEISLLFKRLSSFHTIALPTCSQCCSLYLQHLRVSQQISKHSLFSRLYNEHRFEQELKLLCFLFN